MIPLTLKINNFLSYGNQTQTINFAPYKLICLSGKNGHGKSALLDALTWVLWGQARKISATSKPDQGLVHLGEVEMMVSLDFIFNNQKYRVKRSFSQKYGKPHTHVEFGLLDTATDRFISLTDKTIRKTEEKIISTIGLDYDTFINTCFLRQGQSNEFSKKSSKERKEILSTILGLTHYDQTRKFILESVRELQQKIAHHDHIQERISQEMELLTSQLAPEHEIDQALAAIIGEEKNLTTTLQTHLQTRDVLVQKEEESKILVKTYQNLQEKIAVLKKQITEEIGTWRLRHKKILAHKNGNQLQEKKKALEEQALALQKNLHIHLASKEQLLQIKENIHKEEALLHTELHSLKEAGTKKIIEIKNTLQLLEKKVTEYKTLETTHTQEHTLLENQLKQLLMTIPSSYLLYEEKEFITLFERHKTLYRSWIERANRCKQEMTETHHKQELSNDPDNPSCPLCEQNLSQARKRFLQKKLCDTQDHLTHRFNRLKEAITNLKEHVQKEYTYIQLFEQRKKITEQQQSYTETLKRLEQELHTTTVTMNTLTEQLREEEQKLENITKDSLNRFQHHPTLPELYKQQDHYTALLVTYDRTLAQYNDLQKQIEYLSTLVLPDTAQSALVEEQTTHTLALMQAKKERLQLTKELHSLQQAPDLLSTILTQKKKLEAEIYSLQSSQTTLTQKKQELSEKKAVILHAHEKRTSLEQEKITIEQEKKKVTVQYFQEQSLAQAFSKDGIQALLIEEALPELEYEANDLLARLTDNQAHISIESLRDLKKGGTRETLDINISDAQGVRPYELFSGGEAFRIDFALRIAISKLLARRAGTSLQTLIIDEGFGSQDDEGLTRIMDALYTIQDDFEKIIIVSHLSAMKEQFPVHFVVTKQPQGSQVTVFEND